MLKRIQQLPLLRNKNTPEKEKEKKREGKLNLPVLAPLTLHHEVIRVIRHLTLAVASREREGER